MKRTCFITALILAIGCGEDSFPPETCAAVDDQELFIGETELVPLCYTDPDGDVVTVTATSSHPSVVDAVALDGARAVSLRGRDAGQAVITLVATDSRGLQAPEQVFKVTVPNRAPEAELLPEVTLTNDAPEAMLTLTEYFSDPDDHPLAFSAVVSDPTVIRATVTNTVLEIAAVGGGSAIVRVTATDPHGASASSQAEVAIRITTDLLNDEFDSLSDSWTRNSAVAEIVSGRLALGPADLALPGFIEHQVGRSSKWTVMASMEWVWDDLWPTVLVETDGDPQMIAVVIGGDIRKLAGITGLDPSNLAIAVYSQLAGGRWLSGPDMVGMYAQIAKDTAMDVGVRIGPETLTVLVNGAEIHTLPRSLSNFQVRIPGTITEVMLGAWPATRDGVDASHVAYFDWIRATGVLTAGPSRDEARPAAPGRLSPRPSGMWRVHR